MATAQQVPGSKVNPGINNMVRIMIKKGVVTDLARVPHSLDLSSPNVATTVNAVLRPLETLSRIVNQPSALGGGAASQKPKPKNSQNNQGNPTGAVDAAGTGTAGSASGTVPASASTAAGATTNGGEGRTAGNNGTNTTNSEATRAQVRIKILVEAGGIKVCVIGVKEGASCQSLGGARRLQFFEITNLGQPKN